MKQVLLLLLLLTCLAAYTQEATVSRHRSFDKTDNSKTNLFSGFISETKQQVTQGSTAHTIQTGKTDSQEKYVVSTLAGQSLAGNTDGEGHSASLSSPSSIAVDTKNNLYVADATNHKIRKITPEGFVTTFAGKQTPGKKDGSVQEASFYYPVGIAIDCKGNLYVADKGNHVIRKITPNGIVSTLAGSGERNATDGVALKASFDKPVAVAVDTACNVYVADAANNKIRKITPAGVVTTLAGSGRLGSQDGRGIQASFYNPSGVAADVSGNVYVADHDNNRIRKIAPDGTVTTIAGNDTAGNTDGPSLQASFFYPSNLALDTIGNLYITDQVNHKIRKLSITGEVTTLAGSGEAGSTDGNAFAASFNYPSGIAVDPSGNIYVADQLNCRIRKIEPAKLQYKLATD